jgi:hypothetical protein
MRAKKPGASEGQSASELISKRIADLGDWRGETLSRMNAVKLTFAKGASLKDPAHLFNSSLEGNMRRAIDIPKGEQVDESAFRCSFAKPLLSTAPARRNGRRRRRSRKRLRQTEPTH